METKYTDQERFGATYLFGYSCKTKLMIPKLVRNVLKIYKARERLSTKAKGPLKLFLVS